MKKHFLFSKSGGATQPHPQGLLGGGARRRRRRDEDPGEIGTDTPRFLESLWNNTKLWFVAVVIVYDRF